MTIKELYEIAKELGKENYEISTYDNCGDRCTWNAEQYKWDDSTKEVQL